AAFEEGTDRGLVDEVGPAGLHEALDDGVRHLQGTVRATDARARDARIRGVVVRAERGVGEGRLRFAVPDLLVELLRQAGEVLLRVVVRAVVVARDVDRIAQRVVVHHGAPERADAHLVGDDDLDLLIEVLFPLAETGEIGVLADVARVIGAYSLGVLLGPL